MNTHFTRKNLIIAFALIAIGITARLLLEPYPNIEPIMAVSIIAGALLGPYLGLAVALFTVIGSDVVIGNTNILAYTWTAWAFIGAFSTILKKNKAKTRLGLDTLKFTGWGLLGTIFFYLWTNFGVWQLTAMYPHTFAGLIQSYIMGLPFLRYQLLGNLIIVPVLSFTILAAWQFASIKLRAARKTEAQ